MKFSLYILFLVLITAQLDAQISYPAAYGRNDRFAFDDSDFLYYQGDYAVALEGFQSLYPLDTQFGVINQRIGACLLHLKKPVSQAIPYLEKAIGENYPEARFDYAVALHLMLELDAALSELELYGNLEKRDKSDEELARRRSIILEAKRQLNFPVDVIITNLGPLINTAYSEYVPIVTADDQTLFFTSRREGSTAQMKDANGEFFEDVYYSQKTEGSWGLAKNIGLPINSETHDAVVGTTADGQSIIVYRTNAQLTGGDLYTVKRKGDAWAEPVKLGNEVNTEFQEASACFDPEGDILYFSSNRPGGMGGKDLYRIKRLPNGQWSLPKNMGGTINTAYDEDAPFMTSDRVLYFASSGHNTMGGYDLFKTRINQQGVWDTPENLGYPVNTPGDDIFLSINSGGKKGYFSSDRPGGFGKQDLYEISFIYRASRQVVIKGKVIDQNGAGIPATLTVIDSKNQAVQGEYRSNKTTGEFILVLNPLTSYQVRIDSEGYTSLSDEIRLDDSEEMLRVEEINPYLLLKQ